MNRNNTKNVFVTFSLYCLAKVLRTMPDEKSKIVRHSVILNKGQCCSKKETSDHFSQTPHPPKKETNHLSKKYGPRGHSLLPFSLLFKFILFKQILTKINTFLQILHINKYLQILLINKYLQILPPLCRLFDPVFFCYFYLFIYLFLFDHLYSEASICLVIN